jgi:hypothetical protein
MSLVGLADFVGGKFALPENPVMRGNLSGLADFVGGKFAVPENTVLRGSLGNVGNFVPSAPMWPIPQNSVIQDWTAAGMSGCGCGCDQGMGQLSLSSITAPFTTAFADLSTAVSTGSFSSLTTTDYLVLGGSAFALFLLFGKKGR